ncbi:TolC family protein [Ideonella margarita]|uniref:TolC family protein n=1 Tax=Ideonella margarita TaxID=2984191 RepID=A0ABU9C5B4_9BURK
MAHALRPCQEFAKFVAARQVGLKQAPGLLSNAVSATVAAAFATLTPALATAAPQGCEVPAALASNAATDAAAPRLSMLNLLQLAEQRSKAVGAARLLADAAASDAEETRAMSQAQASFSMLAGATGTQVRDSGLNNSTVLRPSVQIGASLYDGGRQDYLNRWREQLIEAAKMGQLSAAEQVQLQTVSLAFDRSRFRLQAQVWQQYTQKVCGLVSSLEQIVTADKGRSSELVQARKTLQQVQLSRSAALTQMRLTDSRLRRLVGDQLPDVPSMAALMLDTPPLAQLTTQAVRAADIVQLDAQAAAADELARATSASQKPQVGWSASLSKNVVGDRNAVWQAGITLAVPLMNPGAAPAERAARQRADAARMQREDALESLQNRLAQVHEQAGAAFTRARDVVQVLKDSERVRDDTLQMWQQLGRRSLFDVMSAEGDHFNLRLSYVDALHDGQQAVALLWSLAGGVAQPLR